MEQTALMMWLIGATLISFMALRDHQKNRDYGRYFMWLAAITVYVMGPVIFIFGG